ncbi:MAG: hypothetical protein ACRENI_04240 [Gemmatimonadaceae bacterium]
MTWRAVVTALDEHDAFRSKVSAYLHPLAGRPVLWHVLRALLESVPRPDEVLTLHDDGFTLELPDDPEVPVRQQAVRRGDEKRALRAAITAPGMAVLVDGAAPLLSPLTVGRLLRAGDAGLAIVDGAGDGQPVAIAGEGPALASAEDPRRPAGATRVGATSPNELLRVTDRHALSLASTAMRDRLVAMHEANGVTFMLPETTWIEIDVRIGRDTVVYPGVVLEGVTEIESECVIGPHSRIIESVLGRGVELKGWNLVARTRIRNHAVLEAYVRRGFD